MNIHKATSVNIFQTHIFTIAAREFKNLLFSPLGYWVLLCFSVFFWYLYQGACERLLKMPRLSPYSLAPLSAFFHSNAIGIALLMMAPTITMKLFAEEKALGTYELLLTYPVREWQIVGGKFLGAWLYFAILWLPSVFQVALIGNIGSLDLGQVMVAYLWLLGCGAGMLSVGLAVSCLFRSQLASFVTTFTLLLPFLGYIFVEKSTSLTSLYIDSHLKTACRGTLDSSPFLLYIFLTGLSLFIAVKIIEARRWFPLNPIVPKNRAALAGLLILPVCWLGLSTAIIFIWGWTFKTTLTITLLGLPFLRWTVIGYLQTRNCSSVFGVNVLVSIVSFLIIAVSANYLGQRYRIRLDCSFSQAFSLDSDTLSHLKAVIPDKERLEITAMFAFTENADHEYMERDNERYFVLQEAFEQLVSSSELRGNRYIDCEFVQPDSERFRELKSRYHVEYRDVLLCYRNRHYVISNTELFEKKLERSQVSRLLVLWRKIYEAGGIAEPPPDPNDQDAAYEKLKDMANPEMLAIYPTAHLQQVLVNAVLRLFCGVSRRVYFAQGTGEKWISGNSDNQYHSAYRLASELSRRNFEVCSLDLKSSDKIPADCDILVILGTDSRFPHSQKSLSSIDRYLQKGGKVVVLLSPNSDAGIISLLARYGVYADAVATWYLSNKTDSPQKMLAVDIPIRSIANGKVEKIVNSMCEQQQAPAIIHMENAKIITGKAGATSLLRIDDPKIFPDGAKQTLSPPYYLGVIISGANGSKLTVLGNSEFTSDSPSNYYQYLFGDPAPRPNILVGSNRFFLPALLMYLSDPLPIIAVKSKPPLRFYPRKNFAQKAYFWSNLIICMLIATCGVLLWLRDR